MNNILTISDSLLKDKHAIFLNGRRYDFSSASVACILRQKAENNRNKIFDIDRTSFGNFEILFIKRTTRKSDQWSGDIAFPGGFIERDENSLRAAIRETQEEIGIDIGVETDFTWMGSLGKKILNSGRKPVTVFPHLFLFTGKTLRFVINKKEVECLFWVSVELIEKTIRFQRENDFMMNNYHCRSFHIEDQRLTKHNIHRYNMWKVLHYAFGISTISFPCVTVDCNASIELQYNSDHVSLPTEAHELFKIWGLTYEILGDLLNAVETPSAASRSPHHLKFAINNHWILNLIKTTRSLAIKMLPLQWKDSEIHLLNVFSVSLVAILILVVVTSVLIATIHSISL